MTKKDFQLVADVLLRVKNQNAPPNERAKLAVAQVAYSLASEFSREYPRFDRDKFLTAAGFTP